MSHFAELVASATAATNQASDVAALGNVCVEYLGKKGYLTFQTTTLRELPPEEHPIAGAVINEVKEQVQQVLNARKAELGSAAPNIRLAEETINIFLPGYRIENGGLRPVTRITDRIESFPGELGFTVAIGPEIEGDYHNFDAFNISGYYSTRVDRNTFWFNATHLLCTQTSGVQVRTMKEKQPSIHIIAPGRVHRNDYDQTHTPMFHQMEGLIVGTNINFTNLKGALHDFLRNSPEEDLQVRSRPSYFPFTELSAEADVMGKNGKWLGVLGCRTAHPNMLRNVGIDPEIYSGSTFGIGMECLTMLRYGVTDPRSFFENDLRFPKQFK